MKNWLRGKNGNINGTVQVEKGKIIVKDPIGNGDYAKIVLSEKSKLYINDKEIVGTSNVRENDKVIFIKEEVKGKRNINLKINEDKTQAIISIRYEPSFKYEINDSTSNNILKAEFREIKNELPPLFTASEIKSYLQENGIVFGLKEKEIKFIEESREIENLCIVQAIPLIQEVGDKIKIVDNCKEESGNDENMKNIDYKNIISIKSIKEGGIIAEIIKGRIGKDGINIYGQKIKNKQIKKLNFKVGSGCKLEGNKIIATIDGKIFIKKNIFCVNRLHSIDGDVDIKSGNINFPGDVNVKGKVTEGMSIVCNSINILEGSFKSNIKALEKSAILGNIFDSKIEIGEQDLIREKKIEELELLKNQLQSVLENIEFLIVRKLINKDLTDENLIKNLIESKYNKIPQICKNVIRLDSLDPNSKESSILKMKLMGIEKTGIKKQSEIGDIVQAIDNEIELLQTTLNADFTIEYCQESKIGVRGNVLVIGNGSYTSEIFAMDNIEFVKKDSVCRGGYLKASKLIKVSLVGSKAEIKTILQVGQNGHIYAEVAYQGTVFIVGNTKYNLLENSKNVHVFKDKNGEIIVDKLYL